MNQLPVINNDPWFSKGLRFRCTECGKCCTGSPGYVWLQDDDMKAMADHLNLTISDFKKRYTRLVHGRYALTERAKTYDCVFLQDKKCRVYSVRPKQCRTFPWWLQNLKSKESWDLAAQQCEGINHPDAPLIECKEILNQIDN